MYNDKLIFDGEGHIDIEGGNSNQFLGPPIDFYSTFLYPLLPARIYRILKLIVSYKYKKIIEGCWQECV